MYKPKMKLVFRVREVPSIEIKQTRDLLEDRILLGNHAIRGLALCLAHIRYLANVRWVIQQQVLNLSESGRDGLTEKVKPEPKAILPLASIVELGSYFSIIALLSKSNLRSAWPWWPVTFLVIYLHISTWIRTSGFGDWKTREVILIGI